MPMVPLISARGVDALSLRLTRLAAYPGACQSSCSDEGRAGAAVIVWRSKTPFLFPYGPDTWPARVSTSRTYFDIRRRGGRPRPPRRIIVFPKILPINAVGAASPGGPSLRIPTSPTQKGCGSAAYYICGPPGEAAPTRLIERFPEIRYTGRPGVRPVRGALYEMQQEFVGRRGRRPVRRCGEVFTELDDKVGPPGEAAHAFSVRRLTR